ncbi:MAG: hypothetical protein AAGA68_19880 [Pseudomonadota bacterium]
MSDKPPRKLSHQTKGLILIFGAIPIIAFLKAVYDDHVILGAVASLMLALGAIELGKKDE